MSLSSDLFAPERFTATRRPIREASTLLPSCCLPGPAGRPARLRVRG